MKSLFLFVLTAVLTISASAQEKPIFLMIGYEGAVKTYDQAYALAHNKRLPSDLRTLDYKKDNMFYSNWNLLMGFQDKNFILESDLSGLVYIIGAAIKESGGDTIKNPANMIGTGKMKDFEGNTNDGASAYGYNLDIWSNDMCVGKNGFYGGFYFAWAVMGIGALDGVEITQTGFNDVHRNMREIAVFKFGLSTHYMPNNRLRASFKLNRMSAVGEGDADFYDPDKQRKGLELNPSIRYYYNGVGTFGFYAEAFYKYQKWGDYEAPARWTGQTNPEMGTIPSMTNHILGAKVGLNFSFVSKGGKASDKWLKKWRNP